MPEDPSNTPSGGKGFRIATFNMLAVVVVLGFSTKFYRGPAAGWVNNYLGGVFYEIFWCLLIFLLRPRTSPLSIVLTVFGLTCMIELMQLWHPPCLETLRRPFIGRVLLGTTFSVLDFVHYAIGCTAAWFWIWKVRQRFTAP